MSKTKKLTLAVFIVGVILMLAGMFLPYPEGFVAALVGTAIITSSALIGINLCHQDK